MVLAEIERGPPTRPFEVAPVRGLQHGAVSARTLLRTQDPTTHDDQCDPLALWIVSPDNV